MPIGGADALSRFLIGREQDRVTCCYRKVLHSSEGFGVVSADSGEIRGEGMTSGQTDFRENLKIA